MPQSFTSALGDDVHEVEDADIFPRDTGEFRTSQWLRDTITSTFTEKINVGVSR
jgi:hypothetical protein